MLRTHRASVAVVAVMVLMTATWASDAVAWPLSPATVRVFGPRSKGDGAVWCGDSTTGSYGTSFFATETVKVNYGGVCNAAWGRPHGWIQAGIFAYTSTGVLISSSGFPAENAPNSSFAQATLVRPPNAAYFRAYINAWNETTNSWVSGSNVRFA